MKRSIGVTFLGLYYVVTSLIAIAYFFVSKGKFLPFGAPVVLILGIGLLRVKELARKATIIYLIAMLLLQIILYITSIIRGWMSFNDSVIHLIQRNLTMTVISLGVIYFLTRPSVKEQFK